MVILVCGGREYADYEHVCEVLDEVVGWSQDDANRVKVVNGGARGADQLTSKWARERGYGARLVEVPVTPDDWAQYGKAAGPLRNQKMLDVHKPDQGVVFPGGNGTSDMLTRLFHAGVNTWVVGR